MTRGDMRSAKLTSMFRRAYNAKFRTMRGNSFPLATETFEKWELSVGFCSRHGKENDCELETSFIRDCCLRFGFFACSGRTAGQRPDYRASQEGLHSKTCRSAAEGERVFQQNCSRCHTAPDRFSSHISGTIVRHMFVRTSLSRDEEKALLRFFNP